MPGTLDKTPSLVLATAGDAAGPGKVYQVEGTDGRCSAVNSFSMTATGIDTYRDPRDRAGESP